MQDHGPKLEALLADAAKEQRFSHAFAGVWKVGELDQAKIWTHYPDERRIFDLASLTKALATTPLVFELAKQHGLDMAGRVGDWLQDEMSAELDDRLKALTIKDLLRHSSGLPAWRNFWIGRLGEPEIKCEQSDLSSAHALVTVLNRAARDIDPNRGQCYSDVGFLLLGFILEKINKQPLINSFSDFRTNFLHENSNTEFGFPGDWLHADAAITTGFCQIRQRQLYAEVHDDNAASLGSACAHAGLFGSGPGTMAYIDSLLNSPLGKMLLQANEAELGDPEHNPPNEGLVGWRQGADPSSKPFGGGRSLGHMGFTGVAFWYDPARQAVAMFLTNRVWLDRRRPGIAQLRSKVFTLLDKMI